MSSTVILGLALVTLVALKANAQYSAVAAQTQGGRLVWPRPLSGDYVVSSAQNGDACGLSATGAMQYNAPSAFSQAISLTQGQYFNVTWAVHNSFGFGPLTVSFSATGLPDMFGATANLAGKTNLEGNMGYQSAPADGRPMPYGRSIVLRVPDTLTCGSRGWCLMKVSTPYNYVGCAYVNVAAPNTNVYRPPLVALTDGFVDLKQFSEYTMNGMYGGLISNNNGNGNGGMYDNNGNYIGNNNGNQYPPINSGDSYENWRNMLTVDQQRLVLKRRWMLMNNIAQAMGYNQFSQMYTNDRNGLRRILTSLMKM